jgi:anti-anti-sigma factor
MYPNRARRPSMPATSYLAVEEHEGSARRRLSITGGLDLATAPTLAYRLDQLQAEKIDVRLDLSKVEFIDSTGIRVLVTTAFHARDDSRWKFEVERRLDPAVRRKLRVANVEDFILRDHHRRAG